jgi:hypothetical protein
MPLPDHLRGRSHWDWIFPLSIVPRDWTAFDWGSPRMVMGNQTRVDDTGAPSPIGEPGSWQFSVYPGAPLLVRPLAWYFALSLRAHDGYYRHFRVGARNDDIDHYTEWPSLATRRYPVE